MSGSTLYYNISCKQTNWGQIGNVKSKIQAEKGWEAANQKLIYSGMPMKAHVLTKISSDFSTGKVLKDEQTIESYKIEEKGFIVCMVSKVYQWKIYRLG
jgi:UV excision repair protein RAD23